MTKSNLTINTLYKFEQLPNEADFFNYTYRLIARSGKLGAIDQLLEIYPNCVMGLHVLGNEERALFIELNLIFFRNCDGEVDKNDLAFTNFGIIGEDGHYKSDTPYAYALLLDDENPELYFFNEAIPSTIDKNDDAFLQEQRILFNENLEKVETVRLNLEELFLENDFDILGLTNLNDPINPAALLKIKSRRQIIKNKND